MTVADPRAIRETLRLLHIHESAWVCLGAGSNVIVADEGYRGVVMKLDDSFHYVEGLPSRPFVDQRATMVTAGAGALLARLAVVAAEAGLAGLEFACGIPGSVGGGVAMNAGAHGRSMADIVDEIEVATASGDCRLAASELEWGYRYCSLPPGSVVTAVRFGLHAGNPVEILKQHRLLLRQRRTKQPRGARSFGSAFKNPPGETAGQLLEAAGLKGVRVGDAEVSRVHANFLVNLGDATTADVLALMSHMRQEVHRMSGVLLEPEVRLLGTRFPWESFRDLPQEPPPVDG